MNNIDLSGDIVLQAFATNLAVVADATTYFFGMAIAAPTATATIRRIYVPKKCRLVSCYGTCFNGNANGTGETSTIFVRKNGTSDTIVTTTFTTNAVLTAFSGTGLYAGAGQDFAEGDYFEIKWVSPTYVTNPTNLNFSASVFFEG